MNQLPSPQENSPADFRNPSIDNIELPSVPEYSPADYRMKARPGEPQIVADPLPFAHQVCLYQRCIRTHVDGIKEIVSLKTDGGVRNCDEKEQEIIGDISIRSSQDEVHPWLWNNPFCFGKYIASGITQLKDLAQAIILTDEQFEAVKRFFPDDHARSSSIPVYKGAYERVLENRATFFERAKLEDAIPHTIFDMPEPLHYREGSEPGQGVLVGLAAQESAGSSIPEEGMLVGLAAQESVGSSIPED